MLMMGAEDQLILRVVAKLKGRRSVQKPPQIKIKPTTRRVSSWSHSGSGESDHQGRCTNAPRSA
jgi:hypothetical protein